MKSTNKSFHNKSLLNLNIGLIEETSQTFKNYTPKDQISENNPEKNTKSSSFLLSLQNINSPKDKLHTQFTKY